MSLVRAYGYRFDLPRQPVLEEEDVEDLTTAPARATLSAAADSARVAPPREHWTRLDRPVPGRLIAGTLPDDHWARFVLRIPRDWNGRLVAAAAPGVTDETAYDLYFSDFALSRGYAFAATDKAVRRAELDGPTMLMPMTPEASASLWLGRLEALARLARAATKRARGREPERTYAIGLSNGGWVARKAVESASRLFDGAVEVAGVLWRAETGNLLRELPRALRATAREPWDRAALEALGLWADGAWEPVLRFYRAAFWEISLGVFVGDLDPGYAGPLADYDFDARPSAVRERVADLANTGDLRAPLISIAGERDFLIPAAGHARAYAELVRARGKSALHRLRSVPGACHVDASRAMFPFVEPLMPRAHAAFDELVAWVEKSAAPV